ncbi:uncharacterized protein HKW66_Vig0184600 [Vigna angularis]|uniref:Uncharacterized protein n=1 Tax=Phaseolus angularis TaxID=3914 RepID=A0A8T0KTY5_PHAAN|nr:uncharacterized protein HKW66_Vig0184600 [Vigna angularis]
MRLLPGRWSWWWWKGFIAVQWGHGVGRDIIAVIGVVHVAGVVVVVILEVIGIDVVGFRVQQGSKFGSV